MAVKGKIGFSTKKGSYESPPGPPSFNTIIKLIFKDYCPNNGGNYILCYSFHACR